MFDILDRMVDILCFSISTGMQTNTDFVI